MDYLYFNIDMLEITAPGLVNFINTKFVDDTGELIAILNFTGSPLGYVSLMGRLFEYEYTRIRGYDLAITFRTAMKDGHIVKCFTFLIGEKFEKDVSKISFSSAFFAFEANTDELGFSILHFYEKYFSEFTGISRLDLCMDIETTKEKIIPLFDKVEKWTTCMGNDKENSNFFGTYYEGEKMRDKNSYKLFRLYDKKEDTFKKQKDVLFPYLMDYKNVQRLEWEFRRELTKQFSFTVKDLLQDQQIRKDLFYKYMKTISSAFENELFNKLDFKKFEKKSFVFDYLKPISDVYIKRYFSFVSQVYSVCSFKGLHQCILQPQKPSTPKLKRLLDGTYIEINNDQKKDVYKLKGRFGELKEKHFSGTFETTLDPLSYLDSLIKYLGSDLLVPYSKINKVLKRNIVQRENPRDLQFVAKTVFKD